MAAFGAVVEVCTVEESEVLVWACTMALPAEGGARRMVLAAGACKLAWMAPCTSVSWQVPCKSVWEAPGTAA